eukprot:201377_1
MLSKSFSSVLRRCSNVSKTCQHAAFSTNTTKKKHQIVSLDGDGIGPELMNSTKEIISAAIDSKNIEIEWINLPFGYGLYKEKGHSITKDHLEAFKEHKIILK